MRIQWSLPILTANNATNPGILHEPSNPLFAAGYARLVKFIPSSMAAICSVAHKVTLLDVLQERHIAERKEMINRKHDLPLVHQCKALKIHRTTIYREPKAVSQAKLTLMKEIDSLHMENPGWGSRKVRHRLIKMGYSIWQRHCATLRGRMGIHCIYRKPRTTIRHIGHKIYPYLLRNLAITEPNQVWAMDITYIPMAKGFLYLAGVMDIYSRKILSSVISNTLDASFCVEAYNEALRLHGAPGITNTDQGSQFTSDAFVAAVTESGAKLSMDGKGAWTDNIFIERFWRSLKYEEVYLKAYDSVADAKRSIRRYIENYNSIRPHASLGGNTPNEIHEQRTTAPLLMAS